MGNKLMEKTSNAAMLQDNSATLSDSTAFTGANERHTDARRRRDSRHEILSRHRAPGFSGYTLDEMRLNKVVNEMKIAGVRERLSMLVSMKSAGGADGSANGMSRFDTLMRYADIAMTAYTVARRVIAFFRRYSR